MNITNPLMQPVNALTPKTAPVFSGKLAGSSASDSAAAADSVLLTISKDAKLMALTSQAQKAETAETQKTPEEAAQDAPQDAAEHPFSVVSVSLQSTSRFMLDERTFGLGMTLIIGGTEDDPIMAQINMWGNIIIGRPGEDGRLSFDDSYSVHNGELFRHPANSSSDSIYVPESTLQMLEELQRMLGGITLGAAIGEDPSAPPQMNLPAPEQAPADDELLPEFEPDSVLSEKRSFMVGLMRDNAIEGYDEETGRRTITAVNMNSVLLGMSDEEFAERLLGLQHEENSIFFQAWRDEEQAMQQVLQTIIERLQENGNFSEILTALEGALLERRAEFAEDSVNVRMIDDRLESIRRMLELAEEEPGRFEGRGDVVLRV